MSSFLKSMGFGKQGSLKTDFSKFIVAGNVDATLQRMLYGFDPATNAVGTQAVPLENGFIRLVAAFTPDNKDAKRELQCFLLQLINYKIVNDFNFEKIKVLIPDVNRANIRELVELGHGRRIFDAIKGSVTKTEKALDEPSNNDCYDNAGKLIPTPINPVTKKPITKLFIYHFLKAISDTDMQKNTSLLSEYRQKLAAAVPKAYAGDVANAAQGWPRVAENLTAEKAAIQVLIDAGAPDTITQIRDRTNNIVELIRLYNLLNEKVIVDDTVDNNDPANPVNPAKTALIAERTRINTLFYPAAALTHLGPAADAENQFWVPGVAAAPAHTGVNLQNSIPGIKTIIEEFVKRINLFNELNKGRANLNQTVIEEIVRLTDILINNLNDPLPNDVETEIKGMIKVCDANVVLNNIANIQIELAPGTEINIEPIKNNINGILTNIFDIFKNSVIKSIDILKNFAVDARRFVAIKESFKTDPEILKKISDLITEINGILARATVDAATAANDATDDEEAAVANTPFSVALAKIEKQNAALKIRVDELYERGQKLGNVKGFSNIAMLEEYEQKLAAAVPKPYDGDVANVVQGWAEDALNLNAEKVAIQALIDAAKPDPNFAKQNRDQIRDRTKNIVELIQLYNLLNDKVIAQTIPAAAVRASLVNERIRINTLFYSPPAPAVVAPAAVNPAQTRVDNARDALVPANDAVTNAANAINAAAAIPAAIPALVTAVTDALTARIVDLNDGALNGNLTAAKDALTAAAAADVALVALVNDFNNAVDARVVAQQELDAAQAALAAAPAAAAPAAPAPAILTHLGNTAIDENQFWINVAPAHIGTNLKVAISDIKKSTEWFVSVIEIHNRLNAPESAIAGAGPGFNNLTTERNRLNTLLDTISFQPTDKHIKTLANATPMVDRFLSIVKIHNNNQKNVSASYAAEKAKVDEKISKIKFVGTMGIGVFDDKKLKELKELQANTDVKNPQGVPFSTTTTSDKTTEDLQAKYSEELAAVETYGFARFEIDKKKIKAIIDVLNTKPKITEEFVKEQISALKDTIKLDKESIPILEIFKPRVLKLGGDEIKIFQDFIHSDLEQPFIDKKGFKRVDDRGFAPLNSENKTLIIDYLNKMKTTGGKQNPDLLNPYYLRTVFTNILSDYFYSIKETVVDLEITNIEEYDNVFFNLIGKQINIKHVLLLMRELITLLKRNGYDINYNNKNDTGYVKFMKEEFFKGYLENKDRADIAKTFYTITNLIYGKNTRLTNENTEDNFKLRVQAILGNPDDPTDPNNIYGRVTDGEQVSWLKQVVDSLSTRPTNDKYSESFLNKLEADTRSREWALYNGILYKVAASQGIGADGFSTGVKPNSKKLTKTEFYDLFFGKNYLGTAETRIAVSTPERVLNEKPGFFKRMFSGGKKTLKKHNGGKKHGGKKHGKNTLKNIYNMTIKKTNKVYRNTTHKNN